MLINEAKWIGNEVAHLPVSAFPMLNMASGDRTFRETDQPYVEQHIFAPARAAQREVLHADIKNAEGVDVVCDVTTPAGQAALRALGVNSVLCTNMFEHIDGSLTEAAQTLVDLVPVGGYLIVTGPHEYGYHADPIDNGYRPTPAEFAGLFGDRVQVIKAELVRCRRLAFYYTNLGVNWWKLPAKVLLPFRLGFRTWRDVVLTSHRRASASCVVLRRVG